MKQRKKLLRLQFSMWLRVLCLTLMFPMSYAQADGGLVKEITGAAQIYSDNIEAAKTQAERVALNRALERKVGVHIRSKRFVDQGVMLRDVIHAHSAGYAKVIRRVKEWTEENTAYVTIDAWVSDAIPEIARKLSDPRSVIVYISELVIEDRRKDKTNKLPLNAELQAQIEQMLSHRGYKVWFLPTEQGEQVRKALENSATTSIQNRLDLKAESRIQSIGVRDLADVFVIGQMEIRLSNSAYYPNGTRVETTTHLNLLRLDATSRRVEKYPLPPIIATDTFRLNWALKRTVSDVMQKVQASGTVEHLEKWTGPPNRSVVVYVERLPNLSTYEELQDLLRQYSELVEKVEGVIFATGVSKLVLTLTEQSLLNSDLKEQIEYLASALDNEQRYEVSRKGIHTLLLKFVNVNS